MFSRLTLLIPTSALALLVACSDSADPQPTPPAPAVRPTATATAIPTPVPTPTPIVPFVNILTGDDLTKFLGLPTEFQDALIAESKETDNDRALAYLHDLPDDAVPIADLFETSEIEDVYNWLAPFEQRRLLLKGYPNATIRNSEDAWRAGDITYVEYRYGQFEHMVGSVYQILSTEGALLASLEETLSQSALDKLDSLNPLLHESFRLVWENTRLHDLIDPASKLESRLLNMPLEMPGVYSLGLPSEIVAVLEREPELWELAQKIIAADLVRDQEWDRGDATLLQQFVAAYEAPGGKAAFERGLVPGQSGPFLPMACMYRPEMGFSLSERAVPRPLRGVHPSKLIFAWPAPDDALSDAALAKLRLMDTKMRDALDFWWYGTGPLPKEAHDMACQLAQWDRGIADAPFTSMPTPGDLLTEDNLKLYEQFSERSKDTFERRLAMNILKGEFFFQRDRFGLETERYSSYGPSSGDFVEGLRAWSDDWVADWACNVEHLGCGPSPNTPLQLQRP